MTTSIKPLDEIHIPGWYLTEGHDRSMGSSAFHLFIWLAAMNDPSISAILTTRMELKAVTGFSNYLLSRAMSTLVQGRYIGVEPRAEDGLLIQILDNPRRGS